MKVFSFIGAFLGSVVSILLISVPITHAKGIQKNPEIFAAKCKSTDWPDQTSVKGILERVVDGDTVRVIIDGKSYPIRMLSIDTPETHYQGKSQGYWGDVATRRLQELSQVGKEAEVEFSTEKCDYYGRVLGYVWQDGVSLNEEMVKEGLAVMYCIAPNIERCEEYGAHTANAMKNQLGFFADLKAEIPYEWRRRVSNRPYKKYVGSLISHEVYSPGHDSEILLSDRIYFMKKSDIHLPYVIAP